MGVSTQGYPDYQRVSAQAGDVIWSTTEPASPSWTSGVQDAHGYSYLNISVNALDTTAYAWIQVAWQLTSDGTGELSTYAFTPTPGGEQTLQVPVISRYFTVNSIYISGPATDVVSVIVFGCNAIANPGINSQPGTPVISYSKAIAAGVTDTTFGTTTIQGGATLSFTDTGGTKYELLIDFFNLSTGTWQTMLIYFGGQMGQSFSQHIGIPPAPLRVRTVNQDTVDHSFVLALTIDN